MKPFFFGTVYHAVLICTVYGDIHRPPAFSKVVLDAGFPAISAVAFDVDGDGLCDVVAAGGPSGARSPWSNQIVWYRAPGWERKPVDTLEEDDILLYLEYAPLSFRVGVTNNVPDFVSVAGGKIRWHRYDRTMHVWSSRVIVSNAPYAHGCAVGDIDRDGWLDLLVPSQPTAKKGGPDARRGLLWARHPGPDFGNREWKIHWLASSFDIPGWLHYVRLADVNGDGRLDALLGSQGKQGWFGLWLQPEEPNGEWKFRLVSDSLPWGTNLDAADLDGDGHADLVGTLGHGTGVWWFKGPAYQPIPIDETLQYPHCLVVADFDGDRRPDVFTCAYGSRQAVFFWNMGAGRWERRVLDEDQCAYDAKAVDLNQDGRLDILVAGQYSSNVVVYLQAEPDKCL